MKAEVYVEKVCRIEFMFCNSILILHGKNYDTLATMTFDHFSEIRRFIDIFMHFYGSTVSLAIPPETYNVMQHKSLNVKKNPTLIGQT